MSDLDLSAAVEAAAALYDDLDDPETARRMARRVITAAAPVIEAQVREHMADVLAAVREAYYPDGVTIWQRQWMDATDEKRNAMEAAVLAAWSGVRS